jgi:hypothetical protein
MTRPTPPPEIARLMQLHPEATWRHEPDLPLAAIDLVASILNQVRFEPLDKATVDRYIAALEAGDQFPPIVVRNIGNGKTRQLVKKPPAPPAPSGSANRSSTSTSPAWPPVTAPPSSESPTSSTRSDARSAAD